jgi:hypothetical protein
MAMIEDLIRTQHRYRQQEESKRQYEANAADRSALALANDRDTLLADPSKLEKAVANIADFYSPTASTKKPKGESYGITTVEASKAKGDPTAGFGTTLREVFTRDLLDSKLAHVPVGRLLQERASQLMTIPQEDGKSLLEKSHEFARVETSRWFGGELTKKLPGYDSWYRDKRIQEKQETDKESWLPSVNEMATDTAIGAAFGAAAGQFGSGVKGALAGAGLGASIGAAIGGPAAPVTAPIGGLVGAVGGFFGGKAVGAAGGAALGAVIGAGGSIVAAPIKKLIHKTDWYHGMLSSNSVIDKAKAIGVDMAAYIPGGIAAHQALAAGTAKALKGSTIGTLTKDIAGTDTVGLNQKVPRGPGIDLSGERINPEGSWSPEGTTLSKAPPRPFKPAGLLENAGGSKELPEGFGPIPGEGPGIPPGGGGGFTPELPKLLGTGKGYEWPGAKNLTRGAETKANTIDVEKFGPNTPNDLSGATAKAFEEFKPLARNYFGGRDVSDQELFNMFKERSDNRAASALAQVAEATTKAKESITAKPTASNIVETVTKTKTIVKPVEGSDLIQKHEQLSAKGLQESGFEPVVDPDVKPLKGTLVDKVNQAHERDTFVELGKEDTGGKLRTSIEANSTTELKTKSTPLKIDEPVITSMTTVDPTVAVTPKMQEAAIKTVSTHTVGGEAVVAEMFPKPAKVVSGNDLSLFLDADDALAGQIAAAREPMKLDTTTKGIERAKQVYLETLGEKGKPLTEKEILSDIKEMAGDDAKMYRQLLNEQNKEFTTWAKERGFVPNDEMKGSADYIAKSKDRSKYSLVAGMMAFGLTAPVIYDHIAGNKAEAGWLTVSASTLAKKAALVQTALEKGLISETVKPGQTVMGSTNFQRGIMADPTELKNLLHANARPGKGTGTQYALMSPFQILESLFKTGSGKMINAATNLASFVTAGSRTKDNALKVTANIFAEAGIKATPNQVREATAHLVPLGAKAVKHDIAVSLLKKAEERLVGYTGKLAKATKEEDVVGLNSTIKVTQEEITKLKGDIEGLGGAVKDFHDNYATTMQKLIADPVTGPNVRVSLALEDPTRTLFPWLPQLSRNEEVAVGKLRGLLDQYQVRLKDRGIPTRDNYFPHSPHPEMSKIYNAEVSDLIGGAPYQKFYSRTTNSRALLPDINYTMNHYLTDIEPRIQNHDFWKKSGWEAIKDSDLIKLNPGAKKAFDLLYEGTKPQAQTWGNTAARRYAEFEAVHKLFLSPSAGLKHLVKMTADIASVGVSVFAKSLPETTGFLVRSALNKTWGVNQNSIRSGLEKIGVKSNRFSRQIMDDYMDSAIMSGHVRKYMMDMGVESQEQIFNTAKTLWAKTQDVGSMWISLAELADRATSVSSALQMAGKRGMTVDQAMYGTYDLILKNNFLFGQFNPGWLNNPKIRAFFMFQATPFKIFERRFVMAERSLENVKQMTNSVSDVLGKGLDKNTSSTIKKMFGSAEGRAQLKQELFNIRAYMREGQSELKSNLIIDTLRQESDFFGTPILQQTVTDLLTVAAATYGGAHAGLALADHFFHLPFLSTQSEAGKPELAVSPLLSGVMKGYAAWKSREPEEDFLLKSITDRWLGAYGPLPKTLEKAVKLSENDIPEIYRKGGSSGHLKYLFAIPGKE